MWSLEGEVGGRQEESKFGRKAKSRLALLRSLDYLLLFCKLAPALLLYCSPGSTLDIQIHGSLIYIGFENH